MMEGFKFIRGFVNSNDELYNLTETNIFTLTTGRDNPVISVKSFIIRFEHFGYEYTREINWFLRAFSLLPRLEGKEYFGTMFDFLPNYNPETQFLSLIHNITTGINYQHYNNNLPIFTENDRLYIKYYERF